MDTWKQQKRRDCGLAQQRAGLAMLVRYYRREARREPPGSLERAVQEGQARAVRMASIALALEAPKKETACSSNV